MKLLALLTLAACLALACLAAATAPTAQVSRPEFAWVKEKGQLLAPVNGANRVFVVTHTPADAAEFSVYLNGLYLTEGDDYTLVDRTVTLLAAPGTGESLRFWYRARL